MLVTSSRQRYKYTRLASPTYYIYNNLYFKFIYFFKEFYPEMALPEIEVDAPLMLWVYL